MQGRSGRQGDPDASKFFVSLEDDLMRIFGSERMDSMLQRLGLKEGEAIIHPWVNKALAKAQQKVEARNYDMRKQLLKYDDVMNDQRKVIYEQRREIMSARDVASTITDMRSETIEEMVAQAIPENSLAEQWDIAALHAECLRLLALDLPLTEWAKEEGITGDEVRERITTAADREMAEKSANYGPDLMRMAEKSLPRRAYCCRSWTRPGRTICCRSTTCVRGSICAPMPSATRSTSTSARPSNCSRRCSPICAST